MRRLNMIVPGIAVCMLLIAATASHADWTVNGVPICTAPGLQGAPVIASDGTGGIIVSWADIINYPNDWDIYVQRVDSMGELCWTTSGIPIGSGEYSKPERQIVADGSGGAIIIWEDYSAEDTVSVFAQKVNTSGLVQWTAGGVALSKGLNFRTVPDGAGGAIIAFCRINEAGSDIYAQRVAASGGIPWGSEGVTICSADGNQANVCIATDNTGGAIISWTDPRDGMEAHIYAQRIDASGIVQWATDGVVICEFNYPFQYSPEIVSDSAEGAIITWADYRSGLGLDIYAQRIDVYGTVQWATDGVLICGAAGIEAHPKALSDGGGGAIIVWEDDRSGSDDIYAQYVNPAGMVQWMADGNAICTAVDDQIGPCLVSDSCGGAIIGWCDQRSGSTYDIYAQRIDITGSLQWPTQGVPICTENEDQLYTIYDQVVPSGSGGAIFAWQDQRDGTEGDIYAQVVSATGIPGEHFVATLLNSYSSHVVDRTVRVDWLLSEIGGDMHFLVQRSSHGADYKPIGLKIQGEGLSYAFVDNSVESNEYYHYRVNVADEDGTHLLFETDRISVPAVDLVLQQNFPNPFNPLTTIEYYLPEICPVLLEIFDVSGKRIVSLVNESQEKGRHAIEWDGRDINGGTVSSGIYFYRLKAGKETISRKMVLLR